MDLGWVEGVRRPGENRPIDMARTYGEIVVRRMAAKLQQAHKRQPCFAKTADGTMMLLRDEVKALLDGKDQFPDLPQSILSI